MYEFSPPWFPPVVSSLLRCHVEIKVATIQRKNLNICFRFVSVLRSNTGQSFWHATQPPEINDGSDLGHACRLSGMPLRWFHVVVKLWNCITWFTGKISSSKKKNLSGATKWWWNQPVKVPPPPLQRSTDLLSLRSTQPPQALKHVKKYWFCGLVASFEETQSRFPSVREKEPPPTRSGLLRNKKCKSLSRPPLLLPPSKPLQWGIFSNMQEGKIWADRKLYRGAVPASGWEGHHTNQASRL